MKTKITKENIDKLDYNKEIFYYCFKTNSLIIDLNQGQSLTGICIDNVIYMHQLKKIIESITMKKLKPLTD